MRPYSEEIRLTLVILLCVCGFACTTKDRSWDVLALGVPRKIAPEIAPLNMGFYILKQTHEPLLRSDKDDNLFSNILTSWERAPDNRAFTLCPDTARSFDPQRHFTVQYLVQYLGALTTLHDLPVDIFPSDDCVTVSSNDPIPQLLHLLSDYAYAPSVPSHDPRIEYGLGDFNGSIISAHEVLLERKAHVGNGYNFIRFLDYLGEGDRRLKDRSIEDFNRVYISDLPGWMIHEYQKYNVSLLQSINLLINIDDIDLRAQIYNCVDIAAFRKAFMPRQESFYDIATILPVGVPGAKAGRLSQASCSHDHHKKTVKFLNWRSDNQQSLTTYFAEFAAQTGITIEIENCTPTDFLEMVSAKPHPYQLTVVALDAVTADYAAFYEPLIDGEKGILDIAMPTAKSVYSDLQNTEDQVLQSAAVEKLNGLLVQQAVVLPLYQEIRTFHYPPALSNIDVGKNFLQYPEVADIRL